MTGTAGRPRRRRPSKLSAAVLVIVLAATLMAAGLVRGEDMNCTAWGLVFDGYGSASCRGKTVSLSPAPATAADETHAGLAASREVSVAPGRVTAFDATMLTRRQLRRGGAPNPWEVAWLIWSYQDNDHFYALVLKPNGWEVSKQNPAYPGKQQFLASGNTPRFPVGQEHHVAISIDTTAKGRMTATITVEGEHLVSVTDTDSPYRSGAAAAYTEDAEVDVTITPSEP
ncbi:hypothetical protein SAMN05216355_10149 [Actinomyces ruminicola]|uniref:Uncharacterized protein n=2 Tax=Actinomyces ruminicola TaxID=332524 RepID=A0A1G9Z7I5_9ACTO|nr:hypothetical protein SAMN05216355_10149 [Actinomyces ruminicola]